jgi:hypothetical protein
VHQGLASRLDFVKANSIKTLSSVIDVAAPPQIAPQLPELIGALLESLSSLESSLFSQARCSSLVVATCLGVQHLIELFVLCNLWWSGAQGHN